MKKIVWVRVYPDDNVPEYMMGILRSGSVVSEDEDGNEQHHPNLIDNKDFHSQEELKKHVANVLRVSRDIVEIIEP